MRLTNQMDNLITDLTELTLTNDQNQHVNATNATNATNVGKDSQRVLIGYYVPLDSPDSVKHCLVSKCSHDDNLIYVDILCHIRPKLKYNKPAYWEYNSFIVCESCAYNLEQENNYLIGHDYYDCWDGLGL